MTYNLVPNLAMPDIASATQASLSLQDGEAIPIEQVGALLDWVTFNARNNLVRGNAYDPDFTIETDSLGMFCGFGQSNTALPLQKMGLDVHLLNSSRLRDAGQEASEHSLAVVTIPVEVDGERVEKEFLLDITYRQFFDLDQEFSIMLDITTIFETQEQQNFANQLMAKGWVELSEEHAQIYAQGFNEGEDLATEGQSHKDVFSSAPRDNMRVSEYILNKNGHFLEPPEALTPETLAQYNEMASDVLTNPLLVDGTQAVEGSFVNALKNPDMQRQSSRVFP